MKLEVQGYLRRVQRGIHSTLIPDDICFLIDNYYDPWVSLAHIPQVPHHVYRVTDVYYSRKDQKPYFFVSPIHEDSRNIWRYDCDEDQWDILTTYPATLDPVCQGVTIDPVHDILYMFFGQTAIFGAFDLSTKQWTVHLAASVGTTFDSDSAHNVFNVIRSSNPGCIWLPPPINTLHIVHEYKQDKSMSIYNNTHSIGNWWWRHSVFDADALKFIALQDTPDGDYLSFMCGSLLSMKLHDKTVLFAAGGTDRMYEANDKIYFYEATESDKYGKWKVFGVRLPVATHCNAVIYGQVMIVGVDVVVQDEVHVHGKRKEMKLYWMEIECVDMQQKEKEWTECAVRAPCCYTIKLDLNRFLYFMCDDSYAVDEGEKHALQCKIHLSHILPLPLYFKYLQ